MKAPLRESSGDTKYGFLDGGSRSLLGCGVSARGGNGLQVLEAGRDGEKGKGLKELEECGVWARAGRR